MTEYRESVLREAETIVLDKFPRKVLEFNAFLQSERFSFDRLPELMPNLDEILPIPIDDICAKSVKSDGSGSEVKILFKSTFKLFYYR